MFHTLKLIPLTALHEADAPMQAGDTPRHVNTLSGDARKICSCIERNKPLAPVGFPSMHRSNSVRRQLRESDDCRKDTVLFAHVGYTRQKNSSTRLRGAETHRTNIYLKKKKKHDGEEKKSNRDMGDRPLHVVGDGSRDACFDT